VAEDMHHHQEEAALLAEEAEAVEVLQEQLQPMLKEKHKKNIKPD
jgi:hypothetical protein